MHLGNSSNAWDINDSGFIVGTSRPPRVFMPYFGDRTTHSLTSTHIWTWRIRRRGRIRTLFNANGISNSGIIVGEGLYNGEQRGFILDVGELMVPEPAMPRGYSFWRHCRAPGDENG